MNDKEIVVDTKLIHSGTLHGMVNNGGTIKFNNYPFGIRFKGNGSPFILLELYALREADNRNYKTQANPYVSQKAKPKTKPLKPELEEGEEIEL